MLAKSHDEGHNDSDRCVEPGEIEHINALIDESARALERSKEPDIEEIYIEQAKRVGRMDEPDDLDKFGLFDCLEGSNFETIENKEKDWFDQQAADRNSFNEKLRQLELKLQG